MNYRFIIIEQQGSGATLTYVYSDDREGALVCHFDRILSAWDYANRQAEEDSAHVLFKADDGYLDVTNDEFSMNLSGGRRECTPR